MYWQLQLIIYQFQIKLIMWPSMLILPWRETTEEIPLKNIFGHSLRRKICQILPISKFSVILETKYN